jgi:hypothetical protein
MKKIVLGAVIAFAFATPSLAQSYSAGYGTGNLIDAPLLEKTNGAYGYFGTVQSPTARTATTSRAASGTSAYAYSPPTSSPPTSRRHKTHNK